MSVRANNLKKTCPQADPPNWLIYALGGGWGHLTRAVALALRSSARILTNSPFAAQVHGAFPQLDLVILDPQLPIRIAREQALKAIELAAPACLVVDTFPRGLGGELAGVLASLAATKVLVHRDMNPRYVAEANLLDFVKSSYDLILIPGKSEGHAFAKLPNAVVTDPWLIRNADELPSPAPARKLLNIEDNQRCILVSATQELLWFDAVISELLARHPEAAVRCVAPTCPPNCPSECWIKYWPAIDLYPATDVVIGGAGYNTIHECLACNVPLIARPWPRLYDRQWLRARRAGVVVIDGPAEAAAAAIHQLKTGSPRRKPNFHNGTAQAITLIETMR